GTPGDDGRSIHPAPPHWTRWRRTVRPPRNNPPPHRRSECRARPARLRRNAGWRAGRAPPAGCGRSAGPGAARWFPLMASFHSDTHRAADQLDHLRADLVVTAAGLVLQRIEQGPALVVLDIDTRALLDQVSGHADPVLAHRAEQRRLALAVGHRTGTGDDRRAAAGVGDARVHVGARL